VNTIRDVLRSYLSDLAGERDLPPTETALPCGTEIFDYADGIRLVIPVPTVEFVNLKTIEVELPE
jgi:hypothetical protein